MLHNDEYCSVENGKYHHGNHPGFGCKHNQPTQRQPDCADEPDGSNALPNVTPSQTLQYQPPIQQLTIPVQQPFAAAAVDGFNLWNGGGGMGGHSRQGHSGCGGGVNQRTPFANYGCNHMLEALEEAGVAWETPQAPTFMPPNARHIAVPFSNTVKSYANWNVCYTCGFDMEMVTHPQRATSLGHNTYEHCLNACLEYVSQLLRLEFNSKWVGGGTDTVRGYSYRDISMLWLSICSQEGFPIFKSLKRFLEISCSDLTNLFSTLA